jgi:hypothetical protein
LLTGFLFIYLLFNQTFIRAAIEKSLIFLDIQPSSRAHNLKRSCLSVEGGDFECTGVEGRNEVGFEDLKIFVVRREVCFSSAQIFNSALSVENPVVLARRDSL